MLSLYGDVYSDVGLEIRVFDTGDTNSQMSPCGQYNMYPNCYFVLQSTVFTYILDSKNL